MICIMYVFYNVQSINDLIFPKIIIFPVSFVGKSQGCENSCLTVYCQCVNLQFICRDTAADKYKWTLLMWNCTHTSVWHHLFLIGSFIVLLLLLCILCLSWCTVWNASPFAISFQVWGSASNRPAITGPLEDSKPRWRRSNANDTRIHCDSPVRWWY